jgi:hypothetical protein
MMPNLRYCRTMPRLLQATDTARSASFMWRYKKSAGYERSGAAKRQEAAPPPFRVVSSFLCKRYDSPLCVGRFWPSAWLKFPGLFQSAKPGTTALAGDAQGGGSPLVGGAGARCVPAPFAGRAAWLPAWGEPARPGFPPEGETGKGAIRVLAAAGDFAPGHVQSVRHGLSAVQGGLDALAP